MKAYKDLGVSYYEKSNILIRVFLAMKNVKRYEHVCLRCGWKWFSRIAHPKVCASCNNPYWDVSRKEKVAPKKKAATEPPEAIHS